MVSYYLLEYNFFFFFLLSRVICVFFVLTVQVIRLKVIYRRFENEYFSKQELNLMKNKKSWRFCFFFLQRFNEIVKKFLFNISIEYNRNILSEGCTWLLSKLRRKYENVFKLRASLESRLPRPVEIKCRIPFGLQRVK